MTASPRPPRRPRPARVPVWRRPMAAAVIGLVAFDVLALAGLAALGLPLLPEDPPPPPPPAPAPPPPPAPPTPSTTPADRVLDAVVGAGPEELFGAAREVRAPEAVPYAHPFARACDPLPSGTAPVAARSRQARLDGSTGVTLQVWAYGAGQGPQALAELRSALEGCSRVRVTAPDGPGVGRLLAATRSGDAKVWLVTRRGDVLTAVAVGDLSRSAPTGVAQDVAARADALLADRLAPVCPVQDAPVADAARSPYGTQPYQPFARLVPVTAPALPVEPLPGPVTPASVSSPSPRAFPDLAPYLGERDPANPDALPPRGEPPVLVDPDDIPVPSPLVRRLPTEPERPVQPTEVVARVPEPDPVGPGCGWAFPGQQPPVFDEAALAEAGRRALDTARVDLAAATARWQEAEQQFLADYAEYQADLAAYTAYRRYAALRADAEAALASARRAAQPPPPLPTPTPTPTPTPGPTGAPGAPAPAPAP